jgi:hypothetical protein
MSTAAPAPDIKAPAWPVGDIAAVSGLRQRWRASFGQRLWCDRTTKPARHLISTVWIMVVSGSYLHR